MQYSAVQKQNHNQIYLCINFLFLNHIRPGLGVFALSFMLFSVSGYHLDVLLPGFKSVVIKLLHA